MSIDPEALSRMKTLSQLYGTLESTEPLEVAEFHPDGSEFVDFKMPNGWNAELTEKDGTFETAATVELEGGNIYSLTKDAALQATSLIGVTRQYAMKTPGSLMEEHLNYWMNHAAQGRSLRLLHAQGKGLAFTKGGVVPVSNLKVLDLAVEHLEQKYGVTSEKIKVDFKYHHDLRFTHYRLVIAEDVYAVKSSVRDEPDFWSPGLDVQNSLTAEAPCALRVRGYLMNWWNHAGCTSRHATTGSFSRKGAPSEDDALTWLKESLIHTDDLKHDWVEIPKTVDIGVEGEMNTALREIFEKYKVPSKVRKDVIDLVYASEDLTMYGVLAAVTEAANKPDLTLQDVNRLLEIGGDLPGQATGRCKSCHRLPID